MTSLHLYSLYGRGMVAVLVIAGFTAFIPILPSQAERLQPQHVVALYAPTLRHVEALPKEGVAKLVGVVSTTDADSATLTVRDAAGEHLQVQTEVITPVQSGDEVTILGQLQTNWLGQKDMVNARVLRTVDHLSAGRP